MDFGLRFMCAAALAATLLLTACGSDGAGTLTTVTVTSGPSAPGGGSTAEPPGTTEPAVSPEPDGKFTHSCDMLLNSDFNSSVTGWLVADAELTNTGNIGINVNVKAVWKQAGSGPIIKLKHVRLGYGHHRAIHFKVPIGTGQVDAYQSAPGYFDGRGCSVAATIISNFGQAHG